MAYEAGGHPDKTYVDKNKTVADVNREIYDLKKQLKEAKEVSYYAFVAGAAWAEFELHGATIWQEDRNKAEAAAAKKYPFTPHIKVVELEGSLKWINDRVEKISAWVREHKGIDIDTYFNILANGKPKP